MQQRLLRAWLPLAGILLVGINLRPVITAVGPVITPLGADMSLDAAQLGLLGALPIAVFAVASAFVQQLINRFGVETTTAGSLGLLTVATVLRSWPGPAAYLWVGTVLLGVAIAIGNVAVPVLVKQSFPRSTALMTSIYVAVLGIFAGLAAALAVPIANSSALGWRLSLGVWAVLTLLGTVYWVWHAARQPGARQAGRSGRNSRAHAGVNVWRHPVAWQISTFMGFQSGVFYASLTWLPTVERSLGVDPVSAGWHMFILQVAGVIGNLLAPAMMRLGSNQRLAAILPGVLFLLAMIGMVSMPAWIVLWVIVLGAGTGIAFVVSLSLIAMRANDIATAGRLSSMVQAIGYAIAAVELYLAGLVAGWHAQAALFVIAAAGIAVIVMGFHAGRNRQIGIAAAAAS